MPTFLPLHRLLGGVLVSLVLIFVAWACLAHIDIIASANGKLVPKSFIKVSQSAEGGVVREILVTDGQRVTAGQTLLRMDSVTSASDAQQQTAEVAQLELTLARVAAELSSKPFTPHSGNSTLDSAALADYLSRTAAYRAALLDAQYASNKASSEVSASDERHAKLTKTTPIASEQAEVYKELELEGLVSHAESQEKQAQDLEKKGDLATAQQEALSARSAKSQADTAIQRVRADYLKALGSERTTAEAALAKAKSELDKREHRVDESDIKSPVSGTVTGLVIKTTGQVVSAGASLLSVVPDADTLIAEAWLKNEDAPYVAPGMPVKVKLAAYPFQKYGWIEGEVTWLGADSETPDSMKNTSGDPLFYRVRVELKRPDLVRNGKHYQTKTGMQLVADIQIGDRTLIEYLTSPLKRVLLEAAREK